MGKTLYISDTHFGHENVIGFDKRPFSTVEEMDQYMIEYWNMKVTNDDDVYIVGDLQYRSNKGPVWYLQRLKGRKHLIIGNHDEKTLKYQGALEYFESVDKMMIIKDGGRVVHMCHYPIVEWQSYFSGSYHVYGHIHNRLNGAYYIMQTKERALNAAACINNYMPVTLDELIENNRQFREENCLYTLDEVEKGF